MYRRFMENILSKEMVSRGDEVLVALSGGADSVCMLLLMKKLADEMELSISAVHVNHMLRGEESDADEKFCRDLCSGFGIRLDVFRRDVKKYAEDKGMTLEEAGRSIRYAVFNESSADRVAVAHNMDDNAETLLMNLMRGAGLNGLAGISETNGRIIRPLLIFRKTDIEEYCRSEEIDYRKDASNADTDFFRNAVRHRLIPIMDELSGKDVVPLIDRTAALVLDDAEFIELESTKAYERCVAVGEGSVEINNSEFNRLHVAIASRVVRNAYLQVEGTLKDFEKRNTDSLIEMIKSGRTGESMDLSADTYAIIQFGCTVVTNRHEAVDYEYTLKVPGSVYIEERDMTLFFEYQNTYKGSSGREFIYIDAPKSADITVRNRRTGDRFVPAGGNGTKKLKKYFIDRKVHRIKRNEVFILEIDDKIAYIEDMDHGRGYTPAEGRGCIRIGIERGNGNVG